MDAIVSTPEWNQNIFTNSIQLFPDNILQLANDTMEQQSHLQQQQRPNSKQKSLKDMFTDLEASLQRTRQEIDHLAAKDPSLNTLQTSSSSPLLKLDASSLEALNRATERLLRSIATFQEAYDQEISPSLEEYRRHHSSMPLKEQDTVPGLGQAARELNVTHEELLDMLNNIHKIKDSASTLMSSNSQNNVQLSKAKAYLIRGSEDSDIEEMLKRLLQLAATLDRTLYRIGKSSVK
ncbi:hypothetical protein BGZ50_005286 [Haplosporangium sp. Z 11]|nr:hypothetical protein BGZ50_005286 [Haplosporangium sp. Z 11]